ncbi:hypothetical protein NQ314_020723 [Rhamnusium bicolor]|uniref:Uncharacterized protein n=1 Tax=Rhamnusium bicolor TaxID=1586634 RepID=A0AAV8WKP3_9CUCU|nr:hypothetical protein NQ314_020723 [Rhamnusium bicolor]
MTDCIMLLKELAERSWIYRLLSAKKRSRNPNVKLLLHRITWLLRAARPLAHIRCLVHLL